MIHFLTIFLQSQFFPFGFEEENKKNSYPSCIILCICLCKVKVDWLSLSLWSNPSVESMKVMMGLFHHCRAELGRSRTPWALGSPFFVAMCSTSFSQFLLINIVAWVSDVSFFILITWLAVVSSHLRESQLSTNSVNTWTLFLDRSPLKNGVSISSQQACTVFAQVVQFGLFIYFMMLLTNLWAEIH